MAMNVSTTATTTASFASTSSMNNTAKILLITLFISIVSTVIKLQKRASYKKASKNFPLPPGPTPWPLIGNIPEMIRYRPTFRWIHQLMKDMNTDICLIRFGKTNVVPISCPVIAREILKKHDAVFSNRPKILCAKTMSGGYLTTIVVPYNDQWKKMRKVLTSEIISPARHKWLHDKRAEEADQLVFYINNQYKSNKNVNVRIAARHYGGNVIRKMMFSKRYFGKGMPDGGPGPEEIMHVDAIFTALKYLYGFCISDYLPFLEGLDLDGQEKIVLNANKTIRDLQNPLIEERIQQWRSGERKEMEDLLDVFITLQDSDGKPLLNPDEIKNQIAEIMIATIDNPANAVEWAMGELINQPELLAKATEELDRVVGKDRLVQESDIPNLNYVKACAREAFRLHPVAYFNVPHVAMEDAVIGDYFIPKGSWAILSRYGLGRNPKTWPDPLKYDPERHLNEGEVVLTEHDLRFVTFSTGRRGCVAALLGTTMITMMLARMLQCFTWTPPPNVTKIDLSENIDELTPSTPITGFAKPRLAPHLYPTSP
nr:N-hydroxylating cytochrome P450 CYP79D2 [Manihot esculenta]